MPATVTCSCGAKIKTPDAAAAGRTLQCPRCKSSITVPLPTATPSLPDASAPAATEPVSSAAHLDGTSSPSGDASSRARPRRGSWTVTIVAGAVLYVVLLGCAGVFVAAVSIGGLGVFAFSVNRQHAQQAQQQVVAEINQNPKIGKPDNGGKKDNHFDLPSQVEPPAEPQGKTKQPDQPPDLMVIFQHSPRTSIAKLVKRGSQIPAGWQGGAGRILSPEIFQRENQLGAMLADRNEGETATLTR